MSQEFITLELARIYERQGYFQDAFDMYQALSAEREQADDPGEGQKINAGLVRMASALENKTQQTLSPAEKKMGLLVEKWFTLLLLQKRAAVIKQIQS
jgi:hypothetical protein